VALLAGTLATVALGELLSPPSAATRAR
jgi:hypothetical protein